MPKADAISERFAQGAELMKLKFQDWKFALNTLLAVAAVLLPAYFWQADLSAQSLTVRLVSSSALELPADSKVHDMQIIVNGTKIESPHIYSLALINTGSKPIPTGSFETPLQIRTLNDAKLITAQITGSEPVGIPAKLLIEENQIKVLPFLSNPKDQIDITLVSSGPLELVAQARIAGVRDLVFEDASQAKSRPIQGFLFAASGTACLGLYLFLLPTSRSRGPITMIGPIRYFATFVAFASGVYFQGKASGALELTGAQSFMVILPIFALAWFLMVFLERKNITAKRAATD